MEHNLEIDTIDYKFDDDDTDEIDNDEEGEYANSNAKEDDIVQEGITNEENAITSKKEK